MKIGMSIMGWSNGSLIMSDIIKALKVNNVDDSTRYNIYVDLMNSTMGDTDWDPGECLDEDPEYDALIRKLFGDLDD